MTVSLPFCAYAEEAETEEPTAVTYTITFVNYAGETVATQTVKEGVTPTVPETNTAADYDKTNHYTYSWPDVEAATATAVKTYNEKRTEEAHSYGEPTVEKEATCTTAGDNKYTCDCGYFYEVTGEIPATGHRVTKQSFESTEESDAYDLYTCEVCGQTWQDFTKHHWDEGTVVKEPSCTEEGKKVYTCSLCNAAKWETIEKKGHKWSDTSAACLRCKTNDSVVSFTVASCDKTQYYVGDKWNSTLKLNVEFVNHPAVITTKENLLENFSTASAGTVKYSVKYEGQLLKNALQITVVKPKLTVKTASGETAYNDYSYVLGDKGVKFKVQSNTGDKIQYAKGNHLSVSLSNGVYTVKPSKYFTINAKNYKNYYVTFYFNRNGHAYSTKLYFSCGITRLKCNTAASVYTQGASVSKTLSFTQTYIDGTTAKRSVKKSLPTSSVGKKSVSYSYYGQKASYTYYVKCKTPSLKVSAKSKAVSLSWNRISGATGYKIYRATSKNGKYTAVKTISKGSTTSYKNTGLKSKKTYYYKIVAVYSKNSKCNSSYSSAKGCKTK